MNKNRTKLAKAVTMALAGSALSAAAISDASAASTTMYNMFKTAAVSETDGWVYGFDGTRPQGTRGDVNYPTPTPGFVGTASPSSAPFGYIGKSHLNWGVHLSAVGDSAEISSQDSTKYSAAPNYNGAAEIDTGAGAWQDASAIPTGWKHQTDIGLLKSDVTQWVTLNPTRLTAPSTPGLANDNFGITVFTGMDTNTGTYSHHGAWNCPSCATPSLFTKDNPFGTSGLTYLTHDATVDSLNGLTFLAQAGQIYSIYLGGAGVGQWSQNVSEYSLAVTTSAVPVPAAVWLFGSALAGMGIVGRRKEKASVTA